MLFSVIYDGTVFDGGSVERIRPPKSQRRLWTLTERDDRDDHGDDMVGKQRKWIALLTREQFDAFVSHCDLEFEDTETMGSIGAPGFGFGWAPALSFRGTFEYTSAYVTPIPGIDRVRDLESYVPKGPLDRHWEMLRTAFKNLY